MIARLCLRPCLSTRTPGGWRMPGNALSGELALDQLPRLSEELPEPRTAVEYELAFGRDEQNRAAVNGRVKATLFLQCQRCLGILEYPVDREISLALVEGLDEARGIAGRI